MRAILEKHTKSVENIWEKLYEVREELNEVSKEIEKNISNMPTGDFRNTLTEINILLNDVIYKNFK